MRILVAYDATEGAEAALDAAVTLANQSDGEVLLVRVVNPLTDLRDIVADSVGEATRQLVEREQAALEERARKLDVPATAAVFTVKHGDDVGHTLVRAVEEREADIVAVGSRRAGGLRGLLGGVASEVLRLSPRPVLVIRPPAPAR